MGKRFILGIGLVLASLFADTDATMQAARPAAPVNMECQRWAEELGQAWVRDSLVMHQVGCDEGRLTEGVYVRVDGPCNEAARRAYRMGAYPTDSFFSYVESFGCQVMDDGSWIEVQ
jgi:hypothetical protein